MDHSVVDLDKIQAFLSNLSAVTQMHYQIWSTAPELVFSTQKHSSEAFINPVHLRLVNNILMKSAYAYASADQKRFLCGLPLTSAQGHQGVVLASGPVPAATVNGGHPGQMKRLLDQVLQLGQNGANANVQPEPAVPENGDHSFEDLYLFANISKQFRSLRLKQPVMEKLMHRILNTMDGDAAFLHLPDHPEYRQLNIRPEAGKRLGPKLPLKEQIHRIITVAVGQLSGSCCMVDNSKNDERFAAFGDHPFKLMAVPVRYMKKKYGWLGLVSFDVKGGFRRDVLDIMQTMANQLASMMANMEQYDDLERFTVNIVCSLVNAIEAKDEFFQGHSKRVHQYVMKMAEYLQLPAEQTEALKWAAVLHDIGKIGISEKILCKPGKLTTKELYLIKQHPMKGKTILSPVRQLQPSVDAIAYHHENYDGTGYPEGLAGEDIPLTARIIAVADRFDAMTSQRSYHERRPPKQAFRVLDLMAGTQLDPRLVKAFKASCWNLIKI